MFELKRCSQLLFFENRSRQRKEDHCEYTSACEIVRVSMMDGMTVA